MYINCCLTAFAIHLFVLLSTGRAEDRHWSFDKVHSDLAIMGGKLTTAPGVSQTSVKLGGVSILQAKESEAATHHEKGFTLAV